MAHAIAVSSANEKRTRREEIYLVNYLNNPKMDGPARNPYEVPRNPPQKRFKAAAEEGCFVNEALNISQPEKQINPYEVPRPVRIPSQCDEKENHSFVNMALNLTAADHQLNPFEVRRSKQGHFVDECQGIVNPAAEAPLPIAIAVPFTPTINHRIDFGQLRNPTSRSLGEETNTPCSLMSKKLVFSPCEKTCGTSAKDLFTQSLSIIPEEATVDIDEELDCYQLELENSINEAKLHNRKWNPCTPKALASSSRAVNSAVVCRKNPDFTGTCQMNPSNEKGEEASGTTEEFSEEILERSVDVPFKRAYSRPTAYPAPNTSQRPVVAKAASLTGMIRRSMRNMTKNKEAPQQEKGMSQILMSSIRRSLRRRESGMERSTSSGPGHEMSVIIDGTRSVFTDPHATRTSRAVLLGKVSRKNAADGVAQQTTTMLRNSIRRGKMNLFRNILHKENYNL